MNDRPAQDETVVPGPDEDVEGSSLSILMGVDALTRGRNDDRTRKPAKDESLTPLTKPFPRMKDDLRR
jgi:hypothetical protein